MTPDTITKLVELQMKQFNSTRDLKTRINIALWTFLAATAGFAATKPHSRPEGCMQLVVFALFLTLAVLHVAWMIGIQDSLNFDKAAWIKFRKMLDNPAEAKVSEIQDPPRRLAWVVIESGVTVVFIALALAAVFWGPLQGKVE